MSRATSFNRIHETGTGNEATGTRHRRLHGLLVAVLVIAVVLLGIQLIASPIAKSVLNQKLAALPGYRGQVDKVSVQLWRVGGQLENFVLIERDRENDLPALRIAKMNFRFAPRALLHGKLGGQIVVENAEINIVKRQAAPTVKQAVQKAENKVQEKAAEARPWQDALRDSIPMELTRLEVKDSRIRFLDRSHQPNADVSLDHVHLLATGLRNRTDGDPLPAKVEVDGTTSGNGKLKVSVQVDPVSTTPRFASKMELQGLSLPAVNNFLLAYANADVSRGTFDFYSDIKADNGSYNGYVKPFFKDLDFKTASDKDKPLVTRVAKTAANAVVSVLKNKDEQKVATETPVSGNFKDNKADIWTTIDNLLRNAFIQSLREGFGGGGK